MQGGKPEPGIETMPATNLVGVGASMSLSHDSTGRLWQALMPRREEIENRIPDRYFSMRIYKKSEMSIEEMFSPQTTFDKWAAVEVAQFGSIPDGLEKYVLGGGNYAVFLHRGPAREFPNTMRYIFGEWLPDSPFELDDREHFEVLPEKWSPEDEAAEELIYVPIREHSDV